MSALSVGAKLSRRSGANQTHQVQARSGETFPGPELRLVVPDPRETPKSRNPHCWSNCWDADAFPIC